MRHALLIIRKDPAFAEILVFSNIFVFLAVNWVPKWTETVNFSYIPFEPKFKILKDFLNTVFFLIGDYLWSKFQQDRTIFGGDPKKSKKRGHFMDTESIQKTFKVFHFTTAYATLIKLTSDIYLNKVLCLAKFWDVSHKV